MRGDYPDVEDPFYDPLAAGDSDEEDDFTKYVSDEGYLNLKDENVFEEVSEEAMMKSDISPCIVLILAKIRLLFDLRSIRDVRKAAGSHLPQELVDRILVFSAHPISLENREVCTAIEKGHNVAPIMKDLQRQISSLYRTVEIRNSDFWGALVDPDDWIPDGQLETLHDKCAPTKMPLFQIWRAWKETPGALDFIGARLEHERRQAVHKRLNAKEVQCDRAEDEHSRYLTDPPQGYTVGRLPNVWRRPRDLNNTGLLS